jgi:hypothetical protein
MKTRFAALSLVLGLLAFLYPSSVAGEPADIGIRGKISNIYRANTADDKGLVGTVLVDGDKKANPSLDKANLIVTNETRILKQRGEHRVQGAFEDLKVGGRIEARFVEGPTIMIYPLQVQASEIVILEDEP